MQIKVGLGYDIHRLTEGRPLFLGGVQIPYAKGLLGHSDGDCLIHAISEALLGALGEENIGQLFPDSDPKYKDIRSTKILFEVVSRLAHGGYQIVNVDAIVIAQNPPLSEYVPQMKALLCPILKIEETALSIKPRTNEGLGEVGRGEAISAWATALLQK